jgi:hypothetical protein
MGTGFSWSSKQRPYTGTLNRQCASAGTSQTSHCAQRSRRRRWDEGKPMARRTFFFFLIPRHARFPRIHYLLLLLALHGGYPRKNERNGPLVHPFYGLALTPLSKRAMARLIPSSVACKRRADQPQSHIRKTPSWSPIIFTFHHSKYFFTSPSSYGLNLYQFTLYIWINSRNISESFHVIYLNQFTFFIKINSPSLYKSIHVIYLNQFNLCI